ncbi:PorT family protein [Saprospiraceae bacterium]|nr:PorT family protein [Saprospiraceae bacterium]
MKNLILLLFLVSSVPLLSQHKVGIRAGVNFSKFSGPVEEGEDYDISNGFHFGINYTYLFNDILSFRGELVYIQRGTKQRYQDSLGTSYYIVNPLESEVNTVIFGNIDSQLEVTNAYLSIPITAHLRLNRKFEAFGGVSFEYLIGSSGRGLVDFNNDEIFFRQSLDYSYLSDVAGGFNPNISDVVTIMVNDDIVTLPRFVGAYYTYLPSQVVGNRFDRLDANLILGMNYFINPGFYIGVRGEYGVADITNNDMDVSLRELDSANSFILRDDRDNSISLSLSFGFRF